ncbi:hypothetical protein HK101_004635 [Irineochytrium annulatum]|nr:hypothetical protein HK101_004635 [Irineochytrium annulatum]
MSHLNLQIERLTRENIELRKRFDLADAVQVRDNALARANELEVNRNQSVKAYKNQVADNYQKKIANKVLGDLIANKVVGDLIAKFNSSGTQ